MTCKTATELLGTADNTCDTAWHEPETSFGDNAVTGSIRVVGNKAESESDAAEADWLAIEEGIAELDAGLGIPYADVREELLTTPWQHALKQIAVTSVLDDLPPHATVEPVRSLAADPHYREDLPKTVAALEALLALYDRLWDIKR